MGCGLGLALLCPNALPSPQLHKLPSGAIASACAPPPETRTRASALLERLRPDEDPGLDSRRLRKIAPTIPPARTRTIRSHRFMVKCYRIGIVAEDAPTAQVRRSGTPGDVGATGG